MLTSVATVSYAMAAVAYLFLAILLITSWQRHLHGMALTIACLLSALWAATLAYQATAQEQQISLFTDFLEIFLEGRESPAPSRLTRSALLN